MNYRFNVWSAVGTFLRSFERDNSFVLSAGLRLQVTPEGDGREGSFRARGDGILLPSLSAVQIEYESPLGWKPIYYGQVRQGGNPRDTDGENYVLRSLGLRLNAVTLSPGFTAPKQPAHLTVRAMLLDVLASGQLGTPPLLTYEPDPVPVFDTIPDLGFDCREVKASNQQIVGALLEQIVQDGAGLGVEVRWGVGPDRRFFCRPALGGTLILGPEETGRIVWKSPVAETPCTAVLWHIALNSEGKWLTHLSVSTDAATAGIWTKPLTLDQGVNPWRVIEDAAYTWKQNTGSGWVTAATQPALDAAVLKDGRILETDAMTSAVFDVTPGTTAFYALEVSASAPIRRVAFAVRSYYGAGKQIMSGHLLRAGPINETVNRGFLGLPPGLAAGAFVLPDGGAAEVSLAAVNSNSDTTQVQFDFTEFRAETLDTALLDKLATYHYSIPADEPAEVPVLYYGGNMTQVGRIQAGTYERAIDAWEYRISAGRGLEVVALTGQADDPNKLAQAALIKANDGKAIITAVTAQRS